MSKMGRAVSGDSWVVIQEQRVYVIMDNQFADFG